MYCQKCGKSNADDAKFCVDCGAGLASASSSSVAVSTREPGTEMTFGKAISTCLGKYVDFKGRAARPEYWWFYLFSLLLSWGAILVDSSGMISGLVNLALMLPSLAASVRRLHDTGRSGWWLLLFFTIIGLIPLMIWFASKGDAQANKYGDPA